MHNVCSIVLQIWWRTSMKRQRTRQTDARGVHLRPGGTAMKQGNLLRFFKSLVLQTHQTLTPTRDFSISHWPKDVRVRLGLCTYNKNKIKKHPILVNHQIPSTTRVSVVVRMTVVIKASLTTFCLSNKIKVINIFLMAHGGHWRDCVNYWNWRFCRNVSLIILIN